MNLRPDSRDEIIDPWLEKTDLGKVMLEADLQLKKDMANFTSPKTEEGKKYWDNLYKKAEDLFGQSEITIPTLTRPWIVPGEILIRQTKDNAYIYKATLQVMLEQDYLKNAPEYKFDDPRLKILNEYSSELIRQEILPKLIREVNSSQKYAGLRQVYYSLVLAQWFKQSHTSQDTSHKIDSFDLGGLTSKKNWSKEAYFKAYKKSFAKGEYKLQETKSRLSGTSIKQYFSGGEKLVITPEMINVINPAVVGDIFSQVSLPDSLKSGLIEIPRGEIIANNGQEPAKDGGSAQKRIGGLDKAQLYRYGLAAAGFVMFVSITSGFMWGGIALAGFLSAGSVLAGISGGIIGGSIGSAVAYHASTRAMDVLHKRILSEEWEYLQTHKISDSEKDGGNFKPMTKGQIIFILNRLKHDSKFATEFYKSTGSVLVMSADLNIWIDEGLERLNSIAQGGRNQLVGIKLLESLPVGPVRNLMESSIKFYSGLSARKGKQIFGKEKYSELMDSGSSRDGGAVQENRLLTSLSELKAKMAILDALRGLEYEPGSQLRISDAKEIVVSFAPDTREENTIYIIRDNDNYFALTNDGKIEKIVAGKEIGRYYPLRPQVQQGKVEVKVLHGRFVYLTIGQAKCGIRISVQRDKDVSRYDKNTAQWMPLEASRDGGSVQIEPLLTREQKEKLYWELGYLAEPDSPPEGYSGRSWSKIVRDVKIKVQHSSLKNRAEYNEFKDFVRNREQLRKRIRGLTLTGFTSGFIAAMAAVFFYNLPLLGLTAGLLLSSLFSLYYLGETFPYDRYLDEVLTEISIDPSFFPDFLGESGREEKSQAKDGGSVRSLDQLRMALMTNDVHPEIVALQGLRDDYLDLSSLFNSLEEKAKFEKTAHELNRVVGILEQDGWTQSLQSGELNSLQNGDILMLGPEAFAMYHSHEYLPGEGKYNFLITKVDRNDPAKTPLKAKEEQLDIAGIRVLPVAPKDSEAYLNFLRRHYNDRAQESKDGGRAKYSQNMKRIIYGVTVPVSTLVGLEFSAISYIITAAMLGITNPTALIISAVMGMSSGVFSGYKIRDYIESKLLQGAIQQETSSLSGQPLKSGEPSGKDGGSQTPMLDELKGTEHSIRTKREADSLYSGIAAESSSRSSGVVNTDYDEFDGGTVRNNGRQPAGINIIWGGGIVQLPREVIEDLGKAWKEVLASDARKDIEIIQGKLVESQRQIKDLEKSGPYFQAALGQAMLAHDSLRQLSVYEIISLKEIHGAEIIKAELKKVVAQPFLDPEIKEIGKKALEELISLDPAQAYLRKAGISAEYVRMIYDTLEMLSRTEPKALYDLYMLTKDSAYVLNPESLRTLVIYILVETDGHILSPQIKDIVRAAVKEVKNNQVILVESAGALNFYNLKDGGTPMEKLVAEIESAARNKDITALVRLRWELIDLQQKGFLDEIAMARDSVNYNNEQLLKDGLKRAKEEGVTSVFSGFKEWIEIDKAIQLAESGHYVGFPYRLGRDKAVMIVLYPTEKELVARYGANANRQDGGEISQRKLLTKIRFAVRKNDTAALKRLHGQLIQFQQDQIMFAVTMAGSSILFNGEAVSSAALKGFKAAGVTWIFNGFEKKVGIDKAIEDVESGDYAAYLYRVGIENDPLIILHPTAQGLSSRYRQAVVQQDGGNKAIDPLGGVDFRALPAVVTPMVNPAAGAGLISLGDLDKQWSEIQSKIYQGEMPYREIKLYVSSCCGQKTAAKQLEQVSEGITNILKMEEERALSTAPELKEILSCLG